MSAQITNSFRCTKLRFLSDPDASQDSIEGRSLSDPDDEGIGIVSKGRLL